MDFKDEQHVRSLQDELLNLTNKLKGLSSILQNFKSDADADEISEQEDLVDLAVVVEGLGDEAQNIYKKIDPRMWPSKTTRHQTEPEYAALWAEP